YSESLSKTLLDHLLHVIRSALREHHVVWTFGGRMARDRRPPPPGDEQAPLDGQPLLQSTQVGTLESGAVLTKVRYQRAMRPPLRLVRSRHGVLGRCFLVWVSGRRWLRLLHPPSAERQGRDR